MEIMKNYLPIIRMRKIRVSGCANCPYVRFDTIDDKGITLAECQHPSFRVTAKRFDVAKYMDIDKAGVQTTPELCPLDFDNEPIAVSGCAL